MTVTEANHGISWRALELPFLPPKLLIFNLNPLEAEEGIEPSNDGFANHCLTTWLLRHSDGAGASDSGGSGGVSTLGFGFPDFIRRDGILPCHTKFTKRCDTLGLGISKWHFLLCLLPARESQPLGSVT